TGRFETTRRSSFINAPSGVDPRRLLIEVADACLCDDNSDPPTPAAKTKTSRFSEEPVSDPSAIAVGVIASSPNLAPSQNASIASIYLLGVAASKTVRVTLPATASPAKSNT